MSRDPLDPFAVEELHDAIDKIVEEAPDVRMVLITIDGQGEPDRVTVRSTPNIAFAELVYSADALLSEAADRIEEQPDSEWKEEMLERIGEAQAALGVEEEEGPPDTPGGHAWGNA